MAEARLQQLEDTIHDLADVIRKERGDREKRNRKAPTFKFKGNEQQFEFNQGLLDLLDDLQDLVNVGSVNRSSEVIDKLIASLTKRQKLLRIADRSPGGWDTVKEYLSDDVADNPADEKRIQDAETLAVKKKNQRRKASQRARHHPYRRASNEEREEIQPRNAPRTSFGTARDELPLARKSRSDRSPDRRKKCFRCNRRGHLRHECYAKTRAEEDE